MRPPGAQDPVGTRDGLGLAHRQPGGAMAVNGQREARYADHREHPAGEDDDKYDGEKQAGRTSLFFRGFEMSWLHARPGSDLRHATVLGGVRARADTRFSSGTGPRCAAAPGPGRYLHPKWSCSAGVRQSAASTSRARGRSRPGPASTSPPPAAPWWPSTLDLVAPPMPTSPKYSQQCRRWWR